MSENGEKSSLSDREKSLLDDNISLKAQLKELEATFNKMQADFTRSIKMRERLDSLCKVLQKQTQEIKDESASQIEKAEGQGNQLAREVADNMHLMENVNSHLGDIMNDSLKAKQHNTDLTGQVAELKKQYDDRHEEIMKELQAANDDLIKTKTELAQTRLKSAEDRENIYGEMSKLANTLVENRHQMKNAKELELELRQRLQSYEAKFAGLQGSLQDTNVAYNAFSGEMERVQTRTKEFEQETLTWQKKWEVNNAELMEITNKHETLQSDISKVHESLLKMTNLYQSLEKERYMLMKKLGKDTSPPSEPSKDAKTKKSSVAPNSKK